MRESLASVLTLAAAIILLLSIGSGLTNQLGAQAVVSNENFKFVGVKKCKMCHKKEAVGAQFSIWQASAHSKAFETLATPKALEFAEARGIKGSPQEAPECMKCHSTAFELTPEQLAASKITIAEGVSCESCHGPGSKYAKKKTMQKITDGDLDGTTLGLTIPNEAVCITCHNDESPAYKEFNFETFFAKMAHPRPNTK